MLAKNLVAPNEKAVALRTEGYSFDVYTDDTAETGHWSIGVNQHFDKVIVFHAKGGENDVYVGDYIFRMLTIPEENRYKLILKNCRLVGSTTNNWGMFAETSRNPIRYIPYQ